jgi:hypothetical protein
MSISISIQSFWYYSLACFLVIPFLAFVLSFTRWWERPPRYSHWLASIHGWQLGDIIERALALTSHICVESILDATTPPLARLCYTRALAHVGEYVWTIHALVLNTHATPVNKATATFRLLHPLVEVDLPPFINYFHLETKVILNREAFISILAHSPHLSFNGPSGMVYELLRDCFILDYSTSGFDFFFNVCGHIVWGHVAPSILHLFSASQLLTFEKWFEGICPIVIDEVTHRLVAHTLAI